MGKGRKTSKQEAVGSRQAHRTEGMGRGAESLGLKMEDEGLK